MSGKSAARITRVSHEAWQVVQKQAGSLGDSPLPVSLGVCAKAFGICSIRFEPLLSAAGLAKSEKNLEIIVNTEATEDTYQSGTTFSVDKLDALDFTPSLRFTIAHEIAHAAFLRTSGWDKESDLAQKNRKAIEKGCNILARSLLLPQKMLMRELADRLFDIDYVHHLLSVFKVSPEVFLRRLHLSDMNSEYKTLDGFLAFVQETQQSLRIKACHVVGTCATDRFHRAIQRARGEKKEPHQYRSLSSDYVETKWALEGCVLNDLKLDANKDIEHFLRHNESGRLDLEVGWAAGDVIPCNLIFRHIHQQPLGLLLRVQVTGPIQKPSLKTLF